METVGGSKSARTGRQTSGSAAQGSRVVAAQEPDKANVPELILKRCIGLGSGTGTSPSTAYHPAAKGVLAYTAGCHAILLDIASKQQIRQYKPKRPAPRLSLSCLAFKADGNHLAAGETAGSHAVVNPEVIIWEVSTGRVVQQLKHHKNGISSVSFSKDGRLLLSTGEGYDGQLAVWDWMSGVLVTKVNAQMAVLAATFTEDCSAILCGGKEQLKVWNIVANNIAQRTKSNLAMPLLPNVLSLQPRMVSFRDFKTSTFVAVKPSTMASSTNAASQCYALTSSGVLLGLRDNGRAVEKSVNLQVRSAFGLAVSTNSIACACSAGIVRIFATKTLVFKSNLPRPSPTMAAAQRCANLTDSMIGTVGGNTTVQANTKAELFPDAVACEFDGSGEHLTVCYSDHTLVIWNVQNLSKVRRVRCLLGHSSSIWDAALLPTAVNTESVSPTLITCAGDGTIRIWSLGSDNSQTSGNLSQTSALRGVLVAGKDDTNENSWLDNGKPAQRRMSLASGLTSIGTATDGKDEVQLKCIRISHDGRHIAVGDASGNVRVYDLTTLTLIACKEAHEGPVLSLDYSHPTPGNAGFLATAGKDCAVHVFDVASNYTLVNSLDEHSAAVTAVRFSLCGMKLLTASSDRQLLFRNVVQSSDCTTVVYCKQQIPESAASSSARTATVGRTGIVYDMAVDGCGRHAVVAMQGGWLRIYDIESGTAVGAVQASYGASGEIVRITLDAFGQFATCSLSDGSIAVYSLPSKSPTANNLLNGKLIARVAGHAEMVTCALLLGNGQQGLVSVGGDSSILHWELPAAVLAQMQTLRHVAAMQPAKPNPVLAPAAARAGKAVVSVQPAVAKQAWDQRFVNSKGEHLVTNMGKSGELQMLLEEPSSPHAGQSASLESQQGTALSATILRVQKGLPLQSTDKLPKWAAARVPNTTAADTQQPSDKPSAVDDVLQCDSVVDVAGEVDAQKLVPNDGSANAASNGISQQAAQSPPLLQQQPLCVAGFDLEEDDGLVLFDVEEDEPVMQLDADRETNEVGQPGCEVAGGQPSKIESHHQSNHSAARFSVQCSQANDDEDLDAIDDSAASTRDDIGMCLESGGGSNNPAAKQQPCTTAEAGTGHTGLQPVVRDLFKEHYGNLDQASCSSSPVPAGMMASSGTAPNLTAAAAGTAVAALGTGSEGRRLSLTAAVRRLATSLLSAGAEGEAAVIAATSTEANSRAVTAQPTASGESAKGSITAGANVTVGTPLPPGVMPAAAADKVQNKNLAQSGNDGNDEDGVTSAFKPSCRKPAVASLMELAKDTQRAPGQRAGRLENDLAKMRDRLCSLQATFAQQQARNTPWKERRRQASGDGANTNPNASEQPAEVAQPSAENQPTTQGAQQAVGSSVSTDIGTSGNNVHVVNAVKAEVSIDSNCSTAAACAVEAAKASTAGVAADKRKAASKGKQAVAVRTSMSKKPATAVVRNSSNGMRASIDSKASEAARASLNGLSRAASRQSSGGESGKSTQIQLQNGDSIIDKPQQANEIQTGQPASTSQGASTTTNMPENKSTASNHDGASPSTPLPEPNTSDQMRAKVLITPLALTSPRNTAARYPPATSKQHRKTPKAAANSTMQAPVNAAAGACADAEMVSPQQVHCNLAFDLDQGSPMSLGTPVLCPAAQKNPAYELAGSKQGTSKDLTGTAGALNTSANPLPELQATNSQHEANAAITNHAEQPALPVPADGIKKDSETLQGKSSASVTAVKAKSPAKKPITLPAFKRGTSTASGLGTTQQDMAIQQTNSTTDVSQADTLTVSTLTAVNDLQQVAQIPAITNQQMCDVTPEKPKASAAFAAGQLPEGHTPQMAQQQTYDMVPMDMDCSPMAISPIPASLQYADKDACAVAAIADVGTGSSVSVANQPPTAQTAAVPTVTVKLKPASETNTITATGGSPADIQPVTDSNSVAVSTSDIQLNMLSQTEKQVATSTSQQSTGSQCTTQAIVADVPAAEHTEQSSINASMQAAVQLLSTAVSQIEQCLDQAHTAKQGTEAFTGLQTTNGFQAALLPSVRKLMQLCGLDSTVDSPRIAAYQGARSHAAECIPEHVLNNELSTYQFVRASQSPAVMRSVSHLKDPMTTVSSPHQFASTHAAGLLAGTDSLSGLDGADLLAEAVARKLEQRLLGSLLGSMSNLSPAAKAAAVGRQLNDTQT